jgi:hypothetical protein
MGEHVTHKVDLGSGKVLTLEELRAALRPGKPLAIFERRIAAEEPERPEQVAVALGCSDSRVRDIEGRLRAALAGGALPKRWLSHDGTVLGIVRKAKLRVEQVTHLRDLFALGLSGEELSAELSRCAEILYAERAGRCRWGGCKDPPDEGSIFCTPHRARHKVLYTHVTPARVRYYLQSNGWEEVDGNFTHPRHPNPLPPVPRVTHEVGGMAMIGAAMRALEKYEGRREETIREEISALNPPGSRRRSKGDEPVA